MEIEDMYNDDIPQIELDNKEQESKNDTKKKYLDYKDMMDMIREGDKRKKKERELLLQQQLENRD